MTASNLSNISLDSTKQKELLIKLNCIVNVLIILFLFTPGFCCAQNPSAYHVYLPSMPGNPKSINDNGSLIGQQDLGFYLYMNGIYSFPDLRADIGMMIPRVLKINNKNNIFGILGGGSWPGDYQYNNYCFIHYPDIKKTKIFRITTLQPQSNDNLWWDMNDNEEIVYYDSSKVIIMKDGNKSELPYTFDRQPGHLRINNQGNVICSYGYVYINNVFKQLNTSSELYYPMSINDDNIILCLRITKNSGSDNKKELVVINDTSVIVIDSNQNYSEYAFGAINNKNTIVCFNGAKLLVVKNFQKLEYDSVGFSIISLNQKDEIVASNGTAIWSLTWLLVPVTDVKPTILLNKNSDLNYELTLKSNPGSTVSIHTSTNLNYWDNWKQVYMATNSANILDTNKSLQQRYYKLSVP